MVKGFISSLSKTDKLIMVTTPGEVSDTQLTEKGRLQVGRVAEMLSTPVFRKTWHLDIQAIITTETSISFETARIIAKYLQTDDRFISIPGFTSTPGDPHKELNLIRAKTVQEALKLSPLVKKGANYTRRTIQSFSEGLEPGATTLVVGQNYWAELATVRPEETPFGIPPASTMMYRCTEKDEVIDSLYLPPPL